MNAGPQQLTTNTITLELVQTLTSNLFLSVSDYHPQHTRTHVIHGEIINIA